MPKAVSLAILRALGLHALEAIRQYCSPFFLQLLVMQLVDKTINRI
jgi:hypothetical protein